MAISKEARAKAIEDFKNKGATRKLPVDQGGGTVTAATAEQAEAAAKAATPATPAPEPELVSDKAFPYLRSNMGGLECFIVVLTMREICDYTTYASDLYDVVQGDGEIDPSKTWQRTLNKTRASKEIAPYLLKDLHFFPPLVCVIGNDSVHVDNGNIVLTDHALPVLDGQHRRAGIESLVGQLGPDSDFAKESLAVVILSTDVDIEARQQIFADVNRSPKVVSKALNILFDHRDEYARIAQGLAEDLNAGGHDLVDLTRTVPTAKSSHLASLSNLYNLIVNFASSNPKRHGSPMREGLDARAIKELCYTVVTHLPSYDRLVAGTDEYGKVRAAYICYSSTLFQAMGLALKHAMMGVETDQWNALGAHLVSSTKWDMDNPLWHREGQEIVQSGKVGTRSEHIVRAAVALEPLWAVLKKELVPGQKPDQKATA